MKSENQICRARRESCAGNSPLTLIANGASARSFRARFGFRAPGFFRLSAFGLRVFALLLASTVFAETNAPTPPSPPPPPPETPREFYNAGVQQLRRKQWREAEAALQTAAARDQAELQPQALYNLGLVRFQQGAEALKQSPDPAATRARGEAASELADRALRQADEALRANEVNGLLRAYLEGRGARKELKAAMGAVEKALDAHRTTLLRWQRSAGDFKSAHELQPALDDARFNGEVVDRHIAKLVDQQEMLMQCMGGMGQKLSDLKMKMKAMKGKIPGGMLPKAPGDEEEDEEEEGGKREPQKEEGKGKEQKKEDPDKGPRQGLSQEEAELLLNSFKLDANRKLPMGERETARPQDRRGKDY